MKKPRARNLGIEFPGSTGPFNALTDVPGVLVGYKTLKFERHENENFGHLPVRTGVTAILPRGFQRMPRPVWAGQFCLNGNGEMTGTHWIHDAGYFVGPICLTNTHSVGIVHHAATRWMIDHYHDVFDAEHLWAMPVVAETYDGILNDINSQPISVEDVMVALKDAKSGRLAEGNVGGGTGMICYEFKGGTGTASRQINIDRKQYTVGVLVQANHGRRDWLTISGVPVGRELREDQIVSKCFHGEPKEVGSIIVIVGTDAPLTPLSLRHVARRASMGIGRQGTPGGNSSGDIFLAFSTANETELPQQLSSRQSYEYLNSEFIDPIYLATIDAIEESVVNALVAAESMITVKPHGHLCRAIDHDKLLEILERYDKLRS